MKSSVSVFLLFFATTCLGTDEFTHCLKYISEKYFTENFLIVIFWRGSKWRKKALLYEGHNSYRIGKPETPSHITQNLTQVISSEDSIIKSFSANQKRTIMVYEGDVRESTQLVPKRRASHTIIHLEENVMTNLAKLRSEIEESRKVMSWKVHGQILVVIRTSEERRGIARGRLVLEALWTFMKVYKAVFMVVTGESHLNVYKWHPYREECSEMGEPQLVDVWVNGSFTMGSDFYPEDGVKNLNGCPLRVGAFPIPPYVLKPVGHRTNFTKGLDIRIIRELSDYYNFTIDYTTLPEGQFPYIIFDSEGNGAGFHGMLQRQELDIMVFGCRIHELRNLLADPLDSYTEDALVWIVPTPNPVPSWRNIGDAFSPLVWYFFGLNFVLITLVLYLIANYHKGVAERSTLRSFASCVLSSLGMILNNSVPRPNSDLLRIFMFSFALFALNANSAYQSSLTALLTTTRYEKAYVTPMDAVKGGVKTYLFPSGNITYNQTDHNMWNIIFQPGRHAFIEDFVPVLREIALYKNAMVMMAQNVAMFEIRSRYMKQDNKPRALFLKEKFSLYKVTAYVSAGHPLRDHFKAKVNQMVEGGLIGYWLQEVFTTSHQTHTLKPEDEGTKPLTIRHLQGAFFIIIIVLVVSIQVFGLELVISRITRQQTPGRI